MPNVINKKTREVLEVRNEDVHRYELSGEWMLPPNITFPAIFPDGEIIEIPSRNARKAFDLGLTYAPEKAWQQAKLKKEYGSGYENVLAALSVGGASGATLSLSNAALVYGDAVSAQHIEALKEHQPIPYYGGEVLGFLASAYVAAMSGGGTLAAGGTAASGSLVVRGAGKSGVNLLSRKAQEQAVKTSIARKVLTNALPGSAAARASLAASKKVGERVLQGGAASNARMRMARVAGGIAEGTVDAALWSVGEQISEAAITAKTGGPQKSAGTILGEMTLTTLFGAAGGGVISGMWHGFGGSIDKVKDGFASAYGIKYGTGLKNADRAQVLVAKRLVKERTVTDPVTGKTTGPTLSEVMEEIQMTPDGSMHRKGVDEEIVDYKNMLDQFNLAYEKLGAQKTALELAADKDLFAAEKIVREFIESEKALKRQLDDMDVDAARKKQTQIDQLEQKPLRDQIRDVQNQLDNYKNDMQPTINQLTDQVEIKTDEFEASADFHETNFKNEVEKLVDIDTPEAIVQTSQRHLDAVEAVQRESQGSTKISALVDLMTIGTKQGEWAHDAILTLHDQLDAVRKRIELKRGNELYGSDAEIDKVLSQLDSLEESIVERVHQVLKIETKPRSVDADTTVIDGLEELLGTSQAEKRRLQEILSEVSVSNAHLTPDIDLELKQAIFPELDEVRKVLGEEIFGRTSANQLQWNQEGLLRDAWIAIKQLQTHEAFGEAGKRLKRLNEAWEEMIASRSAYNHTYAAPAAMGKNKVHAASVQKLIWGASDTSGPGLQALKHLRNVQARFFHAADGFAREAQSLGLVSEDVGNSLIDNRKSLEFINSEATEVFNIKNTLGEMRNDKGFWDIPGAVLPDEGPRLEAIEDVYERQSAKEMAERELSTTTSQIDEAKAAFKEKKLELQTELNANRMAAKDYRDQLAEWERVHKEEIAGLKARHAKLKVEAIPEAKAKVQWLEDAKEAHTLSQRQAMSEIQMSAVNTAVPQNYVPRMPDEIKGTLGDLRTHGTTSIPGLIAFQAAGWQGAAAASLGATGVIRSMLHSANPETQYLKRMHTYDILQRGVEKRKTMVKKSLEGDLKKFKARKRGSAISKILAVVGSKGRFSMLLGNKDASEFEQATSRLDEIQANPNLKAELLDHSVKGFVDDMPDTAQALKIKISTILDYVHSVIPRAPPSSLTTINPRPYEPPDSALYKFDSQVEMASNWLKALTNGLATKSLTASEVDTLKACYPEIYDELVQDYMKYRQQMKKPIARDIQLVWGVILGNQIDPSMAPQFMTTVAQSFQAGQAAQPDPRSAALKKVPQAYMTPSQQRYNT